MQISHSTAVAVIGAGAWGTVLASLLAQTGQEVRLWTRRAEHAQELLEQRENLSYLPRFRLPDTLGVSSDLHETVASASAAVIALPSQGLRDVLKRLPPVPAIISASKGLETGSFKRFSEIIREYQPQAILAALSGPNLAREIADGKPAAATLASQDEAFAKEAQAWFNQPNFRVYTSQDIIGVEVAGAVKNVIALAAGMCDGLDLGDNAKATIITRGLAELIRLGTHLGGKKQTFYGLAGLGDVIATCASSKSRNHTVGERVARGAGLDAIHASGLTAEGVPTVEAVCTYAQRKGILMPISQEVYRVIYEAKSPHEALHDLMTREAKAEWGASQ